MAWEPTSPFDQTISGKPYVDVTRRGSDNPYLVVTPKVEKPTSLVTDQHIEFYNEFRAVYQTPASYLASDEERKQGYVEHRTDWFRSPDEARRRAKIRSEEDHAYITDIEMSWVTRSKPESIGK